MTTLFALDAGQLIALLAASLVGATVQGTIGFGMGLVLVPTLALISPSSLPVTPLMLTLPMTVSMALRERGSIDVPGFGWLTVGRAGGTVLGVWLLLVTSGSALSVLFGSVVIAAAAMSLAGPSIKVRRRSQVVAGSVSGLFATTAAIGGPPIALIYQHHSGAVLRATLASTFVVGTTMSLVGLQITGQIDRSQPALALLLLIPMLLGLALSRYVLRLVEARWLRAGVLAFAALGGCMAIGRGLVG